MAFKRVLVLIQVPSLRSGRQAHKTECRAERLSARHSVLSRFILNKYFCCQG